MSEKRKRTVWVALCGWDYEGQSLHGVYATKEDAERGVKIDNPYCDSMDIEEHEIKRVTKKQLRLAVERKMAERAGHK